jgi:hypothetical protein
MSNEELERNQATFDLLLPSWLPTKAGQFVVINGGHVVDFYSSYDAAYAAGLDKIGLDAPFFVSEVREPVPVMASLSWRFGLMRG